MWFPLILGFFTGLKEVGIGVNNGKVLVRIDPSYFRPTEVDILLGDSTKANKELGWKTKTKFNELVKIMVESDFKKIKNENLS